MDFSNTLFTHLYNADITAQEDRYLKLIEKFTEIFQQEDFNIFSVPGRTELSGNHTDHNHGRVIAAGINLDSIAAASINNSNYIVMHSEGFDNPFKVDISSLNKNESEMGFTTSLIRGIAARLNELNYNIGGFNTYLTSDVLIGSGLSSSASIEVLIGTIFSHLFNSGKIDPLTLAKTGQYAENNFFGKPCGLMDQMACALGGITGIDFENPEEPEYDKIDINFSESGYDLVIVNTGGSHADLTDDYAAIPQEMKSVAKYFGVESLRGIHPDKFISDLPRLRESVNDRAILRAYHFIYENERVIKQLDMLHNNDIEGFLNLAGESGDSSFKWLQNIYSPKNYEYQAVSLALAMAESFINEKGKGAARVHGGGFAGTIQAFINHEHAEEFAAYMGGVFNSDNVKKLSIRNYGAVKVI